MAGSCQLRRRISAGLTLNTSRMSRLSRSPILMPTGSTRISRSSLRGRATATLRRQPAAERQPEQRDPLEGQFVDQRQIQMHEVVDRVEIGRPLGIAETRRGRGDDLGLLPSRSRNRAFGWTVSMPCSSSTGRPGTAAQHLQLDPVYRQALARPFRRDLPCRAPASCHERPIRAAAHCRAIANGGRGSRRSPRRRAAGAMASRL